MLLTGSSLVAGSSITIDVASILLYFLAKIANRASGFLHYSQKRMHAFPF
jgi:hypothetical protein